MHEADLIKGKKQTKRKGRKKQTRPKQIKRKGRKKRRGGKKNRAGRGRGRSGSSRKGSKGRGGRKGKSKGFLGGLVDAGTNILGQVANTAVDKVAEGLSNKVGQGIERVFGGSKNNNNGPEPVNENNDEGDGGGQQASSPQLHGPAPPAEDDAMWVDAGDDDD